MKDTIRSRIMIGFSLVIVFSMVLITTAVLLTLSSSPLLHRQTVIKLQLLAYDLEKKIDRWDGDRENGYPFLRYTAENSGVSIALLDQENGLLFSTENWQNRIKENLTTIEKFEDQLISVKDNVGRTWFLYSHLISDKYILIIGTPRPVFSLWLLIGNEITRPIIIATLAAILLAVILSWFIGSRISNPLGVISHEAHNLMDGKYNKIDEDGPAEVRDLIKTINYMHDKVIKTQNSQKDFLANISHDLKTPLTMVNGFSQSIIDGTASNPDDIQKAAVYINRESEKMSGLVNQLLHISRMEIELEKINKTQINMKELLEKILSSLQFEIESKQIKIDNNIQGELLFWGDEEKIYQLFLNLIENAIKFSSDTGVITINERLEENNCLVIDVIDQGIGIENSEKEKIFNRFYQIDKSRSKNKSNSVGLGLYIVKQIVEAHNGTISVKSVPGNGSVFTVKLPNE